MMDAMILLSVVVMVIRLLLFAFLIVVFIVSSWGVSSGACNDHTMEVFLHSSSMLSARVVSFFSFVLKQKKRSKRKIQG
jgi:hypothetical protein